MRRFLGIKIALLLLVSSCSMPVTEGLRLEKSGPVPIQNSYFSNPETDYVYKAQMEAYGRNFGGILIVKKLNTRHHRLVMTTEFGSKLLDFEFKNDEFFKNFVIPDLDRKFIIKILKNDFRLLLKEDILATKQFEKENDWIFEAEEGNRKNFYFFSKKIGNLNRMVHTKRHKEKVSFEFYSDSKEIADSIFIKHHSIKLEINLKKFN